MYTQNKCISALVILFIGILTACNNQKKVDENKIVQSSTTSEKVSDGFPDPGNIVEVTTNQMDFQVADTIPSGWTTFRYYNRSPMIHFFNLRSLPIVEGEQLSAEKAMVETADIFRGASKAINAGNLEEASQLLKGLPSWFYQQVSRGGVGLLSSGLSGQTTNYLEPGVYVMECYIRTGGVWHGELGMFKEIVVQEEKADTSPPEPTVTIEISNENGIEVDQDISPGSQIIEVGVQEGSGSIHLVKLNKDSDLDKIETWMTWQNPGGLQTPAPAGEFLGGIANMAAGKKGYIAVGFTPGNYAFLSEGRNLSERDLVYTFTVPGE